MEFLETIILNFGDTDDLL